jgi:hypothetical protein
LSCRRTGQWHWMIKMTTPRGICQFCDAKTAANLSVCPEHVADIVGRAMAGESARYISDLYSTDDRTITRNAIIGLWNRNRPAGFQHVRASPKSSATRRLRAAERMAAKPVDLGDKPVGLQRHDLTGCRWIDHDSEEVYGQHAPGSDWRVCQRRPMAGSSYCPAHHARSVRSENSPEGHAPGNSSLSRRFVKQRRWMSR